MVEIDSSELLSLEELYLQQTLDEETQTYEDMEVQIKKYQEEQLAREERIKENKRNAAELRTLRLERQKLAVKKKIDLLVQSDIDDLEEIKKKLRDLTERQREIEQLKLQQKSVDEELKLNSENDEPDKKLERNHSLLSIVTKSRSLYYSLKEEKPADKEGLGSQLVDTLLRTYTPEKRKKVEESRRRSISSVECYSIKEYLTEAIKKNKTLKRG